MKKRAGVGAIVLTALIGAATVRAHHSYLMYDPTPIWVQGTVVSFEDINPHTITTLEGRDQDGRLRRWAVEGPGQSQFGQLGMARATRPAVGDVLSFCAFPYRSVEELSQLFPTANFSGARYLEPPNAATPQYVWGHVMVTEDGEKHPWNPHGVLGECIRSSNDSQQSWIDYINASRSIRGNWCQQRGYAHIREDEALTEFVAAINALIDEPCE